MAHGRHVLSFRIGKTRITIRFFFAAGMSLYMIVLPVQQALAVFLAVLLHEGTHLLLLRLCGRQPQEIVVGLFGMRMSEECFVLLDYRKELLCVLGAPCVNLLCFLLLLPFAEKNDYILYSCAAHFSLAVFNLLPLRMLDGGRSLQCLLLRYVSLQKEKSIMLILEWITFAAVGLFVFFLFRNRAPNVSAVVFFVYLFFLFVFHK